MKDEAEFNRIVANSLKASKTIIDNKEVTGWGYKISDAAGAYLMATIKSPFDGFGILAKHLIQDSCFQLQSLEITQLTVEIMLHMLTINLH